MTPLSLLAGRTVYAFVYFRGHTLEELNTRDVVQVWQREFECTPMLSTSDCDAIHAADPEYRTPDGSCNNKNNPTWGMAGAVQKRNLAVLDYGRYTDGGQKYVSLNDVAV